MGKTTKILMSLVVFGFISGCEPPTNENPPVISQTTYTVTFEENGGSEIADISGILSGSKILRPFDPIKSEHELEGWYKESDLITKWNFGFDTVTKNTNLYANWRKIVVEIRYSVTFEANGGTSIDKITNITKGAIIGKPANPTKENMVFDAWYKEADFQTKWDFSVDTITQDIILYAKWNDDVITPTTYSVTFEENGGSTVTNLSGITSGSKITKPADPTKLNYELEGWYKEADFQTKWDFAVDTVTKDTILYAKWKEIVVIPTTYSISFEENGGTTVSDKTGVVLGSKISEPTNFTKSEYVLDGWYKESNFQTKWDFSSNTVSENLTLYAKWVKKGSGTGTINEPTSYSVTINGSQNLKFKVESTFTLTYSGTASSYEWWLDENIVTGETGSSIKITPTTSTINYGSHTLTVFVKDENGITYSGNLTLNVTN